MTRSEDLFKRALDVMPGGVSSPVRAFKAVHGTPRFLTRGDGAHVWDVDENRFIDHQMAFGPLLLGHAHPRVVSAVQDTAAHGTAFGAPHELELALAERIVAKHTGADWVRFVNSGTEAVMSAVRVARAVTGRDVVLKFDGCYHGHADPLLVKGGSGLATFGVESSAGVPKETVADTVVLPLDDEDALNAFFDEHGARVACVLLEGVPANNGLLLQRPEFLAALQARVKESGALLVVDEVITGFRLGWGGATEALDLDPDLVTFGKVMGGGLPVAAYGGRADLKARIAPEGDVYQAGTLSGNPLAMAAGLAVMDVLEDEPAPFNELDARTRMFARGVQKAFDDAGVTATVVHEASLLWIAFQDAAPRRADEITSAQGKRYAAFHRACMAEGVYFAPSGFEVAFTSLAHGPAVLNESLQTIRRAIDACKTELSA